MKISIRIKLFFIVFLMIIMFLFLSAIVNVFFLQKYYKEKSRETFIEMFNKYETMPMENNNEADRLERVSGAKVFIADKEYRVKQANMKPKEDNKRPEPPLYEEIVKMIENNKNSKEKNNKIVVEGEYLDERTNLQMFTMVFITKENDYFIIDKPMDTINEGAKIANSFSMITGGVILIFGLISAVLLSKKITEPIVIIDDMLMSIAKLDFSKRYNGKAEDEIGNLGKNLNLISDELQNNIQNLKTTNDLLSHELEKTKKIDIMRKQFISDSSHELKTPIALIRCYSEGLKNNIAETEEEKKNYYDIIMDEADKMGAIVSTLLDISEIDSGESKIEYKEINILKTTEKITDKYRPIFEEKGVALEINIDKMEMGYGDIFKIEQVIENYLCNAINHVSGEQKKIAIYSQKKEKYLRISIYNTGRIIPEDIMDKLWDDFYKEDRARTRTYGGAGLGLAIVRRIIDMHKGKYGVENRENGVEFWFEIKTEI